MKNYCKGCTIARTFQKEHKSAFHPNLHMLGFNPHVSMSTRAIIKELGQWAQERGAGDRWRTDRAARHNIIAQALGMQAHNIATYVGVMSGFAKQSTHPLVLAYPDACGDWTAAQ